MNFDTSKQSAYASGCGECHPLFSLPVKQSLSFDKNLPNTKSGRKVGRSVSRPPGPFWEYNGDVFADGVRDLHDGDPYCSDQPTHCHDVRHLPKNPGTFVAGAP